MLNKQKNFIFQKQLKMEQKQVNIGVKKIKEIEFFVDEDVTLANPTAFKFGLGLTLNLGLADNTVEMVLTAFFSDNSQEKVFMRIKTSNVFLLLELADFHKLENNEYNIPDNVLVTLLSLSISHTRALLAKNAIGTKFADLYIPIVNPSEVFKHLFNKE
jgi:hypothetical protein